MPTIIIKAMSSSSQIPDFTEVEFRTLTIAVLNKLPLDDPEKDTIMKHVNRLEFQAEQSERFYSPGAQFSLSNVKNEPQPHIKQEQVSADMNQDSGLDLEDDNNDEVQVLSVKIHSKYEYFTIYDRL